MQSLPLRNITKPLRLHLQPTRLTTITTASRPLHNVSTTLPLTTNKRTNNQPLTASHRNTIPQSSQQPQPQTHLRKPYSTTQPPTANHLIEELQDLYETAKDEFEIATDSTETATIYAASDRESARDALNQLCTVYHLYTAKPGEPFVAEGVAAGSGEAIPGGGGGEAGEGVTVETNHDPGSVTSEVRDEVRRRVGQRVRELRNAVEVLEERAKTE